MELPPVMQTGPSVAPTPSAETARNAALRETAQEFEAVFIGLMLQQAGLGETRDTFGGGAGEEAFSTMLAEQQGRALAQSGGFGLAEPIYQSLLRAEKGHD